MSKKNELGKFYPKRIKAVLNGETPVIKVGYQPKQISDEYVGEFIDRDGKSYPKFKNKDGKVYVKKGNTKIDLRVFEKEVVNCPLFCPVCGKPMKTKSDEKMWRLRGKCLQCVVKEEHKIRLSGYWNLYERIKINQNKVAFLNQILDEINEYLTNGIKKEIQFINENGKIEKWNNEAYSKTVEFLEKEKKEVIENLQKLNKQLEKDLTKWNNTKISKEVEL